MTTRRHLGRSLAASAILLGAFGSSVFAATEDDDDDTPPNVFISPCGKPFRAPISQPYPVVVWFKEADKNADGKLDRGEFLADAEAFFKVLDVNGDGILDAAEISRYERGIAPEILGYRVKLGDLRRSPGLYGGRLWLAQEPSGVNGGDTDADPNQHPPHDIDETGQGASPFSFFSEPEPVMAADENLNGLIRKAAFLRLAERHFDRLDRDGSGYLTLAKLPKTDAQVKVERAQRHTHRS
jgi:hypothetical protein